MKSLLALEIAIFFTVVQIVCYRAEQRGPESKTVKEIVQANNNFAFKLLNLLGEGSNGNVFFSPTSITVALGMVYLGSRGTTAMQIAEVFDWNQFDGEDIHNSFKTLHEAIHNSGNEDFELKLVNRIWGHDDIQPVFEFSNALKEFYNSNITVADFTKNANEVTREVNKWVHQETNGKIRDFLPEGALNAGTKLALINAIYFNGAWKLEFDEKKTFHAPFYALGSREHKIEVNMMSKTSKQKYYYDEENQCHILELPYSGNELSIILVLPVELDGIANLEKSINIEHFDRWLSLTRNTTVSVALPRFILSHQIELKDVLPKLGIQDLFDAGKADLSGISEEAGLFVSNVIHKAHVEVNERGTEAAAATGVIMRKRSIDFNEYFNANHPFLFFIHHQLSGSIVFAGKLMQPNGIGHRDGNHGSTRLDPDEL